MDDNLFGALKQELEMRLKELKLRVNTLESALDAPKSKDWNESAQESAGDQVMEELGNNGLAEIAAIEAALERIRQDTYGICTKCSDEISDKRLKLLPHTPFCNNCA